MQSLDLVFPVSDQQRHGCLVQSRFCGMKSLCQHRFSKKRWWLSLVGSCIFGQLLSVLLQLDRLCVGYSE